MAGTERKRVVFTDKEWANVSSVFLEKNRPTKDLLKAVESIMAWRLRSHREVPLAADVSELVLRSIICDNQEEAEGSSWWTDENIRLQHAMTIVRFVNYAHEIGLEITRQAGPIHSTVHKLGVPLWVTELRHSASHHLLPSMVQLRRGINFCFEWLKNNYWSQSMGASITLQPAEGDVLAMDEEIQVLPKTTTDTEDIHAELLDFEKIRSWEVRHGCLNKKKASKMKTLLRKFKEHLNSRKQLFLNIFISEGHLVLNSEQLKAYDSKNASDGHQNIPYNTLQEFWKPLFMILGESESLGTVMITLVDRIGSDLCSQSGRQQLLHWLRLMIDGLSNVRSWSGFSWRSLLTAVLQSPRYFPDELINKMISILNPPMPESDIANLRNVVGLMRAQQPEDIDLNIDQSDKLHSVAELQRVCLQQTEPDGDVILLGSETEVNAKIKWKDIPIGLAPNQTAEDLDLDLDI